MDKELDIFKISEKCTTCNQYWSPSLIETGTCIFCICTDLKLGIKELSSNLANKDIQTLVQADLDWRTLMADIQQYYAGEKSDVGHGRVQRIFSLLSNMRNECDSLQAQLDNDEAIIVRDKHIEKIEAKLDAAKRDTEIVSELSTHLDSIDNALSMAKQKADGKDYDEMIANKLYWEHEREAFRKISSAITNSTNKGAK